MRTRTRALPWKTTTLALIVLGLAACLPPKPTCEPGDPSCEQVREPDPQSMLSEDQAQAELDALHRRFELAAADGLETEECRSLTADFQRLYERDPSLSAARFNVAAVWESCGEPARAEAIYLELAEREHPQALNNLGALAWARGEHERAFALFERSVAADRTHAFAARNNLAMALRERYASKVELADFTRAEQQLQNILAVDSSNKTAYENLARLYYDRGRLEDASYLVLANLVVTQAERVLATHDQRSADLHNLRGLLLIEDDDQVRALRAFRRALELEPGHLDANRNIAMVAIRFRDYEGAVHALEAVIDAPELAGDVESWLALGVARRGLRDYEGAAEAYRHASELERGDPRPWYNLGVLAQDHLSGAADDEEALTAVYEQALAHYETFVTRAGSAPRWRPAVAEAKDRIVVIRDSIETIEKMRALEEDLNRLEELAAKQREAEIERLRRREAEATSVGEIVGDEPGDQGDGASVS